MLHYLVEHDGDEYVQLWSVNLTGKTTEQHQEWSGVNLAGGMVLSDGRIVVVWENATKVEFWALHHQDDRGAVMATLVHQMNVTKSNQDNDYYTFRYTPLSTTEILFSGYDEAHGSELWKLTYDPRTIVEDAPTLAPEPTLSPSDNSAVVKTITPSRRPTTVSPTMMPLKNPTAMPTENADGPPSGSTSEASSVVLLAGWLLFLAAFLMP